MDVYLVRHAIAEQRDWTRWPDDSKRPLTPEGSDRFRRAARGLRRIAPDVESVLSSPYVRAWQTAEILHDECGWPAPERCDALAADASTEAAAGALRTREDASVALVGHEPNLSSLASLLLAGAASSVLLEVKKGAVLLVSFAGEPVAGQGILRWSASPRLLRGL
jgi:phosphohistidine phosphatase